MQSRSRQLLEFPKVLAILAGMAVSEPGAARCLATGPVEDLARLEEEIDRLRQWIAWSGENEFTLREFPSLDGFLDHATRPSEVFDLDALFAVMQVLATAKTVRELLQDEDDRWPMLARDAAFAWPETLWSGLKRCLNTDGNIRDEASPELYGIRQEIRSVHQRCTSRVKTFVEREGVAAYLQEEFMTVSADRYVLPLKVNYKNRIKGIIHDYSQTGETCYFEPMFLVDLNNELQELKNDERRAEKEVLRLLSGLLRQDLDALDGAYDYLVAIDVLAAKAAFAAAYDARPVAVAEGAPLKLLAARHPLLAAGSGAVAVDLALEEGQQALVISGGNAGGKTVALKTLGLSAVMALSALPVCVDEGSSLPAWRKIFVLLGDEQSIEDSLSTFTAQIRHLSSAWEAIDDSSLVIMDEFGAGTDPSQGAALAQAVVDGFLDKGSWLAVATHFPALKAYALSRERVRAASVLFHPDTKKPLYVLAYDQVGASQALDVAREHGLPEMLLDKAQQYMLLDGSDTSAVVERLNTLAVERERELADLRVERDRLHEKRAKYHERFERERAKLLDEVQARSQSIMRQWREDKIGRKQALKELAAVKKDVASRGGGEEPAKTVKELAFDDVVVGDTYRHAGLGKTGVAAELDARKKQVKLDLGGVSVWAKIADLAPGDGGGKTAKPKSGGAAPAAAGHGGMTVDLRGMRADEAENEVYRFLDGAVLSGRTELEIIHGRGTGALRKQVHRLLRDFPAVGSYELAPEDRGGDGMTIVQLK